MGKRKEMSDEQLDYLGLELSKMCQSAISAWETSMKILPINSEEYRSICGTGKKICETYFLLRDEAEIRGWKGDR